MPANLCQVKGGKAVYLMENPFKRACIIRVPSGFLKGGLQDILSVVSGKTTKSKETDPVALKTKQDYPLALLPGLNKVSAMRKHGDHGLGNLFTIRLTD